jgi:hypothetical protein
MLHCNKMCNILHKRFQKGTQQPKGNIMIEIEKYFKQYEALAEQVKQANEFWYNAILSSAKSFYSTKK